MHVDDKAKANMHTAMFSELCALRAKETAECEVEICAVSKDGYLRNSKYVGALSRGERIHRIDTEYGVTYVRSSLTSADLRRFMRHDPRLEP